MGKIKIIPTILAILILSLSLTGCWNYKEVDQFSTVAGVAVDRAKDGQYELTAELIEIKGGKDAKTTSVLITAEGKTIFDAARSMISLSGKKLYWSHAKVVILSQEIAKDGLTKVMDWFTRDSETREDTFILISGENSAKEIFAGQASTEDIKSFELGDMLKSQISLNKAPATDVLQFDIATKPKGASTIIPVVTLQKMNDVVVPEVMGTAIIKDNKLAGFLSGEETIYLNFIRDEIKGGVLVEQMPMDNTPIRVSLELFKNKTKISSITDGNNIKMNLDIDTTVAIDEIDGIEDFKDEKARTKLEQISENSLKGQIQALITKVQTEYDADIFGFDSELQEDKAPVWNRVGNKWNDIFKDLKVNVKTNMHIKNSATVT